MKILFLLLVSILLIACNMDRGITQRTRCENDALNRQGTIDTESCIEGLIVFSRRKDSLPEIQAGYDLILLACLNYAYEMTKCEKKSNMLPP